MKHLHNFRAWIRKTESQMMKFAYFNGIIIKASKNALCHQIYVIDTCR